MKKLILSAAVVFALSASTGLFAQDKKQDKTKEKTECCSEKKKCDEKKSCCSKDKKDKKCKSECTSKETPKKETKK